MVYQYGNQPKDQRGNRNISCIRKTMQKYIEWITYIHISMDRWEKSRAGIQLDTDQERICFGKGT